jgi:hypothetical protein
MMPQYKEKGMAIGGTYLLHKNPKEMDYAKYKLFGRSRFEGTALTIEYVWEATRTIRITSGSDKGFVIYENDHVDNMKVIEKKGLMQVTVIKPEFERELHVDKEGNILKVRSNFGMGNQSMRKVKIAKPDEDGQLR